MQHITPALLSAIVARAFEEAGRHAAKAITEALSEKTPRPAPFSGDGGPELFIPRAEGAGPPASPPEREGGEPFVFKASAISIDERPLKPGEPLRDPEPAPDATPHMTTAGRNLIRAGITIDAEELTRRIFRTIEARRIIGREPMHSEVTVLIVEHTRAARMSERAMVARMVRHSAHHATWGNAIGYGWSADFEEQARALVNDIARRVTDDVLHLKP